MTETLASGATGLQKATREFVARLLVEFPREIEHGRIQAARGTAAQVCAVAKTWPTVRSDRDTRNQNEESR